MPKTEAAREAELAAMLYGALVGSLAFRGRFLQRAKAHRAEILEGLKLRVEYSPGDASRRFDIYIRREDPRLEMAVELKRSETGLEEQQLREYLSLLRVLPKDCTLRRRKNAPKYSRLVVVTGATEMPEVIARMREASNGFLQNYLEWCSWYELVDLLHADEGDVTGPGTSELLELLGEQGYVSERSVLPRLRSQEKILSKLSDVMKADSEEDDMEVLQATLGRMEYEMAKLGYGVTIHVTAGKRGKKTVTRQRQVRVGKPLTVLDTAIKGIGRAFLPNETIRVFHSDSKKTRKQTEGVGLAFSVHQRAWVAYIKPRRGHLLPKDFLTRHQTRERVPLNREVEGIHGWYLKGSQKQPRRTAAFLDRAWIDYVSGIGTT